MAKELAHADKASKAMTQRACEESVATIWDRYESMQPQCKFGSDGVCCRICSMGPCRISKKNPVGICGADVDTIVARNLVRMIAGGTAAHSDHGRDVAHTLLMAAENSNSDYSIKDADKLKAIASVYDVETKDRGIKDIAKDVAHAALNDFGRQEGKVRMASTAPAARQKLWDDLELYPRAIDREVVEMMHRTTMGVDADYKNVIKQGMRTALADGWGGSMIGTELSDVVFGSPNPLRSTANLGVIEKEQVNIIVHGHEPTLSDIIAIVSQKPELVEKAKAKGARGIRLAGICCTANEILMRHGIPIAGSFMQQELAVMTGAIDVMVVDVQCVMPALSKLASCFHTKLVTTSPKSVIPEATHIQFEEEKAVDIATKIIETAIDNYPNRNQKKVFIPQETEPLVAGFTAENTFHFLGGKYRSTYRPLNNAIMEGRLRGAAGVIGCSNPNVDYEEAHLKMVKELIKNDTIVVTTGCNAITCAKHGLLKPEAAFEYAGEGLQEICSAVGIPPVLHLGACVDNSRILKVLTNIVSEGGLGTDISDLPVAGAAPEWMSEKAVAIGFYFVASGVYTVIGHSLPIAGSQNLTQYLTNDIEKEVGGKWAFELDPIKAAQMMLSHIDKKRQALKLKPMVFGQAYKPAA